MSNTDYEARRITDALLDSIKTDAAKAILEGRDDEAEQLLKQYRQYCHASGRNNHHTE